MNHANLVQTLQFLNGINNFRTPCTALIHFFNTYFLLVNSIIFLFNNFSFTVSALYVTNNKNSVSVLIRLWISVVLIQWKMRFYSGLLIAAKRSNSFCSLILHKSISICVLNNLFYFGKKRTLRNDSQLWKWKWTHNNGVNGEKKARLSVLFSTHNDTHWTQLDDGLYTNEKAFTERRLTITE